MKRQLKENKRTKHLCVVMNDYERELLMKLVETSHRSISEVIRELIRHEFYRRFRDELERDTIFDWQS